MKRPNFFLVGAPKSGTTALATYLGEHPSVYVSYPKEPNFFNDDFPGMSAAKDLDEYMRLFAGAGEQHLAVGEATVNYLYSRTAIPNIRRFNEAARLIVLLRNPVDLIHSFHFQMLYDLNETESNIEKAWALQEKRARGDAVPARCRAPQLLQYRDIGRLGAQLQRLYEHFPPEQVCVTLTEDLGRDPRAVYETVLQFLNVPADERTDFPRINESKAHRNAFIARWTKRPPKAWITGARLMRRLLGKEHIGLLNQLNEWNKQPVTRPPLSDKFRGRLLEEFRDDIELLESLLGRDLSRWKSEGAPARSNTDN